jgi:hypothetical protein
VVTAAAGVVRQSDAFSVSGAQVISAAGVVSVFQLYAPGAVVTSQAGRVSPVIRYATQGAALRPFVRGAALPPFIRGAQLPPRGTFS